MLINELRISFVQVEVLASPLRSKQSPKIPFAFLLNGPDFRTEFSASVQGLSPPWDDAYARFFWHYYIRRSGPSAQEIWRAMVPLEYPLNATLKPSWPGTCLVKAFLYPWGAGILVDALISDKMEFRNAVNKALDLRWSALLEAKLGTGTTNVSLPRFVASVFDLLRKTAFAATARGATGELFTIVTAVDGAGADLSKAVQEGDDVHKGLEALVSWDRKWENLTPPSLAANTIATRRPVISHLLYGQSHARAVWFPAYFKNANPNYPDDRLPLYHQNLTMAALQTEGLGLMAEDVARQLNANLTVNDWSVAYAECAKRAAGLLGRLHGGTPDTYRSRSVQAHIQRSFKSSVNTLRTCFQMAPLVEAS